MGKRGATKHMKRLAAPKAIPVTDKKARKWIIKQGPGPHPVKRSMALGVLLRDILGVAKTARESKKILSARLVEVDGRARTSEKFPVGLMDVISFRKGGKHYRIVVDWKGRLVPYEINDAKASKKLLQVVGKHTIRGGKLCMAFHDGTNMNGDNHVHVGDSVVVSLPKVEMKHHLKLENGARCLIREGKHAGSIVKLKEIIERPGSRGSEARVEGKDGEFITVAKYLFVVDNDFEVGKHG